MTVEDKKGAKASVRYWTPEENDALLEMYRNGVTLRAISQQLGVDYGRVRTRVGYLGLSRSSAEHREQLGYGRRWTASELAILQTNYATTSMDQMVALLPGRTKGQIYHTAFRLSLSKAKPEPRPKSEFPVRRWTLEEDAILRKMYLNGALIERIAERLNISVHRVRYRVETLSLSRDLAKLVAKPMTACEESILRDMSGTLNATEIRAFLMPRRTVEEILEMAHFIGVPLRR